MGYLRKPGGSAPVQVGKTEEQEEAFREACVGTWGGPRQRYFGRKRISQMELVCCAEGGQEERASKRARASEAWEEEVQEEEALFARMVVAIDEGVTVVGGAMRFSGTGEVDAGAVACATVGTADGG